MNKDDHPVLSPRQAVFAADNAAQDHAVSWRESAAVPPSVSRVKSANSSIETAQAPGSTIESSGDAVTACGEVVKPWHGCQPVNGLQRLSDNIFNRWNRHESTFFLVSRSPAARPCHDRQHDHLRLGGGVGCDMWAGNCDQGGGASDRASRLDL